MGAGTGGLCVTCNPWGDVTEPGNYRGWEMQRGRAAHGCRQREWVLEMRRKEQKD